MRLDVRENTRRAAAAELEHNGDYLAFVSGGLVESLTDQEGWSDPVQVKFTPDPNHPGIIEIQARTLPK